MDRIQREDGGYDYIADDGTRITPHEDPAIALLQGMVLGLQYRIKKVEEQSKMAFELSEIANRNGIQAGESFLKLTDALKREIELLKKGRDDNDDEYEFSEEPEWR